MCDRGSLDGGCSFATERGERGVLLLIGRAANFFRSIAEPLASSQEFGLSFRRFFAHLRVHPSWLRSLVPSAAVLAACAGAPANDLFAEPELGRDARGGAIARDAASSGADSGLPTSGDASEPLGDASGTVADASLPVGLDASGGPFGDAGVAAQDAALSPTYTADACLATPRAYTVSCDLAPWRLRTAPSTAETACGTRSSAARAERLCRVHATSVESKWIADA